MPSHIAEVITDGSSQVVRIPAEFHIDANIVEVRRNPGTGELILAAPPKHLSWGEFFDFIDTLDIPEDFMAERPMNRLPIDRPIFEDR